MLGFNSWAFSSSNNPKTCNSKWARESWQKIGGQMERKGPCCLVEGGKGSESRLSKLLPLRPFAYMTPGDVLFHHSVYGCVKWVAVTQPAQTAARSRCTRSELKFNLYSCPSLAGRAGGQINGWLADHLSKLKRKKQALSSEKDQAAAKKMYFSLAFVRISAIHC